MSALVIHALPVAGGILAIAPMPGGAGDYAADLAHMREWQPALVISLTTRIEMIETGSESLGQDMQERGARWVHLPIADFGTPDREVNARWREVSAMALRALAGGGRVLVHCKGGCGRSGMIALRLMIEAGEAAGPALKRLRTLRPCAIETEAQMDWALRRRSTARS
ncbi:MAG: protein phosphatase [Rhodobacterales bacterium]|nr:protein phosphatase [Rhodobacterales bacterium]MDX5413590.1 protein phosphatase [Rhodobacterales bacterium]